MDQDVLENLPGLGDYHLVIYILQNQELAAQVVECQV